MPADSKELEVEPQDSLVEVNLGTKQERKITYVSTELRRCDQNKMIELLKEYRDYFALDYDDLTGLEKSLVEHKLPIKPGYKPVKQQPQRMTQ